MDSTTLTGSTTTGDWEDIDSVAMLASEKRVVKMTIKAEEAGGDNVFGTMVMRTFFRTATDNVVAVGPLNAVYREMTLPGLDVRIVEDYDPAVLGYKLQAKGKAGMTFNWTAFVEYL